MSVPEVGDPEEGGEIREGEELSEHVVAVRRVESVLEIDEEDRVLVVGLERSLDRPEGQLHPRT